VAAWYGARYGIDTSDVVVSPLPFTPLRALDRTRGSEGPVHVVSIGKVQRLKGAHLFVDAAIELLRDDPDGWRFTLVGGDTVDARTGGSLTASLCARVPGEHTSRIAFPGQVDRDALAAIVADADVLVYPNRVETYCLAAYEALPSGRPAVLSSIAAFDVVERVRSRAGLVTVRFDDPAELPDAIRAAARRGADGTPRAHVGVDVGDLCAGDVSAYAEIAAPTSPVVDGEAPLVSVVVPYYEMQDHVAATVASVLASSYRELEVIVVDDGTPSEVARRRLDELAPVWAADGRVRVVHRTNGGLGAARNTGIAEARGAFVLPVDSDDLVDERMVEVLATALRRAPHLDAVSCYTKFFEDESTREPVDWVIPYDLDPVLLTLENRAGVASSMFRRSVFEDVRYDERLWAFEDWSLWWSIATAGRRAAVVPEVLFHYRRRPGSMVKGVTPSSWAVLMEMIADRHESLLHERGPEVYGLLMSSFVATRAELHAAAGSAAVEGSAASSSSGVVDLYREAQGLRAGRAGRLLDRVRAAARRVRRPWRPATVTVIVTARPRDESGRTEVCLGGVRPTGSNVYLPVRTRGWEARPIPGGLVDPVWVATLDGTVARFRTVGDELGLLVHRHPWSTAIDVTTRTGTCRIDLHAEDAAAGFVELRIHRDGRVVQLPPVGPVGSVAV
jgi:glycosyltransferase involved in cell wall biosynthesis